MPTFRVLREVVEDIVTRQSIFDILKNLIHPNKWFKCLVLFQAIFYVLLELFFLWNCDDSGFHEIFMSQLFYSGKINLKCLINKIISV